MGMKLVNYRTFRSNKEFVEWQLSHDKEPLISQIMPWVMSLSMSGVNEQGDGNWNKTDKTDLAGDTECGCFVVYLTEEN